MNEFAARAAVVAEAIAWLGTPYHHRAKLKGVGVDCAQLVLGVYAAVGLVRDFDTGDYPQDWHLHRETERYLAIIRRLASEIALDRVQPGDVLLFKFGRAFSHGAIVTAWPQIVHANRKDGAVVMGDVSADGDLIGRPMLAFSYWAHPAREAAHGR
jgi:NlpC/P60 family putative phage cell wall peptidase